MVYFGHTVWFVLGTGRAALATARETVAWRIPKRRDATAPQRRGMLPISRSAMALKTHYYTIAPLSCWPAASAARNLNPTHPRTCIRGHVQRFSALFVFLKKVGAAGIPRRGPDIGLPRDGPPLSPLPAALREFLL